MEEPEKEFGEEKAEKTEMKLLTDEDNLLGEEQTNLLKSESEKNSIDSDGI